MKKIAIILLASATIVSLAGCTQWVSPSAAKQEKACNDADVVLSNLTKPVDKRTYSLKPGVICHG